LDAELRTYLEGMEARLRQDIDGVETRLRESVDAMEARLREHTADTETRLLGEFWKWARTADARYRQNHAVVQSLEERVLIVEDRVAELERERREGGAR